MQQESITSLEDLRTAAPLWDDLWWRSDIASPLLRAELVARWVEHFRPKGEFRAVVVRHQDQYVAALPMVRGSQCRLLGSGGFTSNEWAPAGDLLLDPSADVDAVLDHLTDHLRGLHWPVVWFQEIDFAASRWTSFGEALCRAGVVYDCRHHMQFGRVEIDHDWDAYRKSWTKKHRGKMNRVARRLAEQGDVCVETITNPDPMELVQHMQTAWFIEDRSWKGEAGTSVLRTPGMVDFYLAQARALCELGHLELSILHCDGQPASFSYGSHAKGVSHWHKIGYDPAFRCCTPGQLLQYYLLEQAFHDERYRAIDFQGTVTDALSKWNPTTYNVGRLVFAPRRWHGRVALWACKYLHPLVRRLQRGVSATVAPAARQASTPSEVGVGVG